MTRTGIAMYLVMEQEKGLCKPHETLRITGAFMSATLNLHKSYGTKVLLLWSDSYSLRCSNRLGDPAGWSGACGQEKEV